MKELTPPLSNQKSSVHQTPEPNRQGTPHPLSTEEDTIASQTRLRLDTNSQSRSKI